MSQIDIQVFEQFVGLLSEEWLERIAASTLAQESERAADYLSIVIADDETVRDLNRQHRGLDENTDVLSFSFEHEGEYYGNDKSTSERSDNPEFIVPPGQSVGLGEVIISYPQVARQAGDAGHTAKRELALMLAHGILHLLGYDHMEPGEEAEMKAKETSILAQVLEENE